MEENQKLGSNPGLGTTVFRGANILNNEVVAVKKIEKYLLPRRKNALYR